MFFFGVRTLCFTIVVTSTSKKTSIKDEANLNKNYGTLGRGLRPRFSKPYFVDKHMQRPYVFLRLLFLFEDERYFRVRLFIIIL